MASRGNDPGWRDRNAVELLLRNFPVLEGEGPLLVVGDPLPDVPEELARRGSEVQCWDRRAFGGRAAHPWPSPGPYRAAALRLPRSKAELAMSLEAVAGVLSPGAVLLVYGAKDEGVGSATALIERRFQRVETLAVGGHCRVLRARRDSSLQERAGTLEGWRELHPLDVPGLPEQWVSYPGVFAQGHLDQGTNLLLQALPGMGVGDRVLDFGCGSGIVGAALLQASPGVQLHLLDVDSVALEAARENVPEGSIFLGDGLAAVQGNSYEAILTNPPFHRGKEEDPGMIRALILESPSVLSKDGRLVLVAQKRLRLEEALRESFKTVSSPAEGAGFRIWEGRQPRIPGGKPQS
jgi:16S rRNA (guanine1207-N2)-methyltransferase